MMCCSEKREFFGCVEWADGYDSQECCHCQKLQDDDDPKMAQLKPLIKLVEMIQNDEIQFKDALEILRRHIDEEYDFICVFEAFRAGMNFQKEKQTNRAKRDIEELFERQ